MRECTCKRAHAHMYTQMCMHMHTCTCAPTCTCAAACTCTRTPAITLHKGAASFFFLLPFSTFRCQSHAAARSVLKALTRSVRCVEPRQLSASQLLAFCFLFSGTLLSCVTRQGSCPRDCFCPKIIVVALRHFSYLLAGRAPRVASPTSACLSVLA